MTIRVYKDETVALALAEIVENLQRLAPNHSFELGKARFSIPDRVVSSPGTYALIDSKIDRESCPEDRIILFTEKPYDNNYFFEANGNKVIVSLYAWEHLTALSRNNGAVYFICALLVRGMDLGRTHRLKNTGCVNDFWRDKRGIDLGMRSGHICAGCLKDVEARKPNLVPLLDDVQAILDSLGGASRGKQDICELWKAQARNQAFDVFLCHNNDDKPTVRKISQRLREANVNTWLDEEQLPPGRAWQDQLEAQIQSVKTAAILVGGTGIGPWQNVETRAFLQEFIRRECPVIPVILEDCIVVPQLPLFLRQLTWVDFRKSSPDPFGRLLWGITGVRPSY